MKRYLSMIFILLLGVHIFSAPLKLKFRTEDAAMNWDFYGPPMKVIGIQFADRVIPSRNTTYYQYMRDYLGIGQNLYHYVYNITVRRPGNDDGSGVILDPYGVRYRLYYWVSDASWNVAAALAGDYQVRATRHPNDRRLIVLQVTLLPGTHSLMVVPFPYPMYGGQSDFKWVVSTKRSTYFSFIKELLTKWRLYDSIKEIVKAKPWDVALDIGLKLIASMVGERIRVEVPAIMPKITTRTARDAAEVLKMCSLVPAPDYRNTVPTDDSRFDKRVALQQYKLNQLLKAGTRVAYKFYKYSPSQVTTPGPAAIDFWVGTWNMKSLHKTGSAAGRSFGSNITIYKKGNRYGLIVGGKNISPQNFSLSANQLTYTAVGGGNKVHVRLHPVDRWTIKGTFQGNNVYNQKPLSGTYTGKRPR